MAKTRIPITKCNFCKEEVNDYGIDSTLLFIDDKTVLTICRKCYLRHFKQLANALKEAYSAEVLKNKNVRK